MVTTLTTIDVSEWQDPETVDWSSLISQGLKSVIVRLSHGFTADKKASAFVKKAQSLDLIVHGYHFYEGNTEEVSFSVRNAQQIGLQNGAHFFLDMEGNIPGDWQAILYQFAPEWLRNGWKPGLYCSDSPYKAKFNNAKLVSDKITRWIASYDYEPANYDVRQYTSSNGKLDLDYDKSGLLEVPYEKAKHKPDSSGSSTDNFPPLSPGTPTGDSWVGWGKDSRYGGGQTLGYSPNGKDFYAVFWPGGLIIRPKDAEQIWELIKDKVKRAGVDTGNLTIAWDKITNKPDISIFAKATDVHVAETTAENALSSAEKAQATADANSKALADKANRSELPVVPTDLVHTGELDQIRTDITQAKQESAQALAVAKNANTSLDTSNKFVDKKPSEYQAGFSREEKAAGALEVTKTILGQDLAYNTVGLLTSVAVDSDGSHCVRQRFEVIDSDYPYTFERTGTGDVWRSWHGVTVWD